jgi:serine-aspartate repeat-containing protein C/D/E
MFLFILSLKTVDTLLLTSLTLPKPQRKGDSRRIATLSWKPRFDQFKKSMILRLFSHDKGVRRDSSRSTRTARKQVRTQNKSHRHSTLETLETRVLFNVDPLWVGGVYVEEDNGGDAHGDSFYITFKGGAAGTQLNRLVIDTDQGSPGFSTGDNIFDTVDSPTSLGADHAFPFKLESIKAVSANARVSSTVTDGGMQLVLTFENFFAGDKIKFSIDVDEIQRYRGNPNPSAMNPDIDPITSGVEFADSKIKASFSAPHFEDANTEGVFVNAYDTVLANTGLDLPGDDVAGLRDRTAGAAATVVQVPKPIELAGTVYVDNNLSLTQQANEPGISGVSLALYRLTTNGYASTGFTTTTDSQGRYRFGLDLGLAPGTYQIRESQPANYLSVGAVPGLLNGIGALGKTVANDKDILTDIQVLDGDSKGTQLDFAEAQPVQISGFVYRDNNDDGNRANDETGIGGVEIQVVSLDTIAGSIDQTTRTKNDGSYQFLSLPPGRYRIIETSQPIGFFDGKESPGKVGSETRGRSPINDEITEIRLDGNDNGIEFNFGEIEPSVLSGHVCVAMPGFDCFSTEPNSKSPLPGVKIELVNASGSIVATTLTGTDGTYRFENLPAGVYNIVETQPANLLDGGSRAGTINGTTIGNAISGTRIEQIRLGGGQQGSNYDFCEQPPASLSGHVYQDDNNDGVLQSAEKLLAGAIIRLFDESGTLVAETTTNASGQYRFDSLRKGNYRITETTPSGYLDGKDTVGTIGGTSVGQLDGVDSIRAIRLPSGMQGVDYDFGEILPASIAGNVYEDTNGDCIHDPGERNLANVQIELLDARGIVVATTRTDASGNYRFEGLTPGNYTLRETQPAGYVQGGQKAGSVGGNDSIADVISAIALGAGVDATRYDFCEQRVASLEGMVFADLNEDCIFDNNELPIAGVRIELLDAAGRVVQSTLTDANGNYRFVGLLPGKYSVREVQPAGYFQGGQMAPAGVADTSIPDLLANILLASGQNVQKLDFCEVPPATISGYVFQDGAPIVTNDGLPPLVLKGLRDGIRNTSDTPIGSVVLELRTRTGERLNARNALPGTYNTPTIRVQTDANGFYEFKGLRPGAYHIYEVQPTGYIDGRDTPGSIGGFSINSDDTIGDAQQQSIIQLLSIEPSTNPGHDAILLINLTAGVTSVENNFSEIVVQKANTPAPPPPINPPPATPPLVNEFLLPPVQRLLVISPTVPGIPDQLEASYAVEYTWHLSVINAGEPRGHRVDKQVSRENVAKAARMLNASQWTIDTIDRGRWVIVSTNKNKPKRLSREAFDVDGAIHLAGDFNGDGRDELALFKDGEWLLDINGNGIWDNDDLWAKLGEKGDKPVVGDWDNDGKDDIGIFGPAWDGDELALDREPGLPDPENRTLSVPKNLPPRDALIAMDNIRLMQRSVAGKPRSDVIDHVFRFGNDADQPVAGDFNGDGVSTLGVFNSGKWRIDVNGDGRFADEEDSFFDFGQAGDIAVVGDFNGDGLDEVAVVRGRDLIVDSNGNGQWDATDRVFELEGEAGQVVVGDFDGDGIDEAAFYASIPMPAHPEARTAERL